jgi:hypothetical protein
MIDGRRSCMGVGVDKHIQLDDGLLVHLPAHCPLEHIPRHHLESPHAAHQQWLPQQLHHVVAAGNGEGAPG